MEQPKRKCSKCGSTLASDNRNGICGPCQTAARENPLNKGKSYDELYYDLYNIQDKLGLSYEQARRKAQHGEIPGRVPSIRRYLFAKDNVDNWLQQGAGEVRAGKLSEETVDVLVRIGEAVNNLEDRLPISGVVETLEKKIPIQEVAKGIIQFVQEAPPPDVVLNDILRSFIKK